MSKSKKPNLNLLYGLAFQTGLDLRTVERAFDEPHRLSPKSRDAMQRACAELGVLHLAPLPPTDEPEAGQ